MKKRILSIILTFAMIIGIVMAAMPAIETQAGSYDKPIMIGVTAIEGKQRDLISFGRYKQYKNDEGGFDVYPIQWRVLSTGSDRLFLMADKNLDMKQYSNKFETIYWSNSTLRSWLNGLGADKNKAGIDYSSKASDSFINTAFTPAEQAGIATVNLKNDHSWVVSGGGDTQDKIYMLSHFDVVNEAYGFDTADTRKAKNTEYVNSIAPKRYGYVYRNDPETYWWLRDPASTLFGNIGWVTHVDSDGFVQGTDAFSSGLTADDKCLVRPVINIDSKSVLFTSMAGGKKCEEGVFKPIVNEGGRTNWKLTLLDKTRSGFTARISGKSGNKVTVSYENAVTGNNEFLSAMILDKDGAISYYTRVRSLHYPPTSAGKVTIELPENLPEGSKLYVFNEKYNGEEDDTNFYTDYASEFREIDINANIYNVTFNRNGHGDYVESQTAAEGTLLDEPDKLEEEGFIFGGWYTDKDFNYKWDFEKDTVTKDITLYAKWTPEVLTGDVVITGSAKYHGALVVDVYNSNNTGEFNYQWQRNGVDVTWANGSRYQILYTEDIGAQITCVVTSTKQSGSISGDAAELIKKADGPDAPNGIAGIMPTSADADDGKLLGVDEVMEYSVFEDFSTPIQCGDGETIGLAPGIYYVRVAETATHYAGAAVEIVVPEYEEPEETLYTVVFNTSGKGVAPAPVKVAPGALVPKPQDPSAEGVTFVGWYLDDNSIRKWDFENNIVTTDMTLTALWSQDPVHMHDPQLVPGKAATCIEKGVKNYYKCNNCGKCYEDRACLSEIDDIETWKVIDFGGHVDDDNDYKCDVCEMTLKYVIVAGANQSITREFERDVVIISNGEYIEFDKIKVDGETLALADCSADPRGTILVLDKTYVEGLAVGKHRIEFVFEDGSVETALTIKEAETPVIPDAPTSPTKPDDPTDPDDPTKPGDPTQPTEEVKPGKPQTGDNSSTGLWIALALAALTAGATVVTVRKGKKDR